MTTTEQMIRDKIPNGTLIQKPESKEKVQWDETADGRAFIICGPKNLYLHDFIKAREIFHKNGKFDRADFKSTFPVMSGHSGCNFTTIGGMLMKLGEAVYERGVYRKK